MREAMRLPLSWSAWKTPLPTVPPPIIPRFTCCIFWGAEVAGNQGRGQFIFENVVWIAGKSEA